MAQVTTVTYRGEPLKGEGSPVYVEDLGGFLYPNQPVIFSDSFAASHGFRGGGTAFANFLFNADHGYHQRRNERGEPLFVVETNEVKPKDTEEKTKAPSGKGGK